GLCDLLIYLSKRSQVPATGCGWCMCRVAFYAGSLRRTAEGETIRKRVLKMCDRAGKSVTANSSDPTHRLFKPVHRGCVREPDPAGCIESGSRGCRHVSLLEPAGRNLHIVARHFHECIEGTVRRGSLVAHPTEFCHDKLPPPVKLGTHLFDAALVAFEGGNGAPHGKRGGL